MNEAPHEARFLAKVNKTDACWLWTSSLNNRGYGTFSIGGRSGRVMLAHRVAYEMWVGPVPDGLELDHLCRTPTCVNPAHLEPVTPQENARRTRKTYCHRGHEKTPENTASDRHCLACRRLRYALRRAAR